MAVIRPLGPDDWAVLRDVRLRALADAPDAFGSTLEREQAFGEADWRRRVGGVGPVLVAYDAEEPVAMGGLFVPDDDGPAMVWGMWTAPDARRRGIGRQVLDALLEWCRDRGRDVVLDVTEGNPAARALYVGRGFRSTGRREPLRDGSPLRVEELRLGAGEY